MRRMVVNKFEMELQKTVGKSDQENQKMDNNEMEKNSECKRKVVTIQSPLMSNRRSLGSPAELEKRKQSAKMTDPIKRDQIERKQRRSSLLNDRRQLWVATLDKSTMTKPIGG